MFMILIFFFLLSDYIPKIFAWKIIFLTGKEGTGLFYWCLLPHYNYTGFLGQQKTAFIYVAYQLNISIMLSNTMHASCILRISGVLNARSFVTVSRPLWKWPFSKPRKGLCNRLVASYIVLLPGFQQGRDIKASQGKGQGAVLAK
jgi:hypothetical protein